jgi:hypothetical protein
MQVAFPIPPVAAPTGQPAPANPHANDAGADGDSFASLLDSNAGQPPAPGAKKPATDSSTPEIGTETPDPSGVEPEPADDDGTRETDGTEAVSAAFAPPPPPVVVPELSMPVDTALADGEAAAAVVPTAPASGTVPDGLPTSPETQMPTAPAGAAQNSARSAQVRPPKLPLHPTSTDQQPLFAADQTGTSPEPADTDEAPPTETLRGQPVTTNAMKTAASASPPLGSEQASPAAAGVDVQSPDLAAASVAEAVPLPETVAGAVRLSPAPLEGTASRPDNVQAFPGMRVAVQSADASLPPSATVPTAVNQTTGDATAAALASPVVAAPTLAQMLVEAAQRRGPRGTTSTGAESSGANQPATDVAFPGEGTETATATMGASDDTSTGGDAPEAKSGGARENLAVTSGKSLKTTDPSSAGTARRNFLNVDQQGVGAREASVGTGTAKEPQLMAAHTPVLPHASTDTLDVGEPTAASVSSPAATTTASGRLGSETSVAHTTAAEAVRETVEAAERAQQAGRNHVELRLQTSDSESVRVHLRVQDGVVHARFVTQNAEMQQALSREWEHLAPRLEEKGLKFSEPSFENNDRSGQSNAQNASTSDQQRQSSHDQNQTYERAEEQAFALPSSKANNTAVSRRSASAAVASAAVPAVPTTAEARGLRAWA